MKYSSVCLPGSVARASPPFIFRNYPPSPVLPPRASLPCRIHRVLHLFQLPPPSTLFVVVVVVVVVVIVIVVELLVSGPLPSFSFSSPLHSSSTHPQISTFVRSFVLCQRGGGTGISNPRCFSLTSPSPMNDARKWSAEHPSLFLERAGFFERVCSRFISDVSSNCTKSLVRNFIRTTCKN